MHSHDTDDFELMRALQNGSEHAFWTLWIKHSGRLFRICLREMGGNHVDAEDALHEAMLRAYVRLPRFAAGIASPASWLMRMTSNVCKDIHRNRVRFARIAEHWEVLRRDCEEIPEVQHGNRESDEYDPDALAALLPDRLRDVFVLRILQRMPYPDIAGRLGLTCVTVRKRVQQSRATLRAWRSRQRERPVRSVMAGR